MLLLYLGGLHSTEEAFLLPTQQPQVQIRAMNIFLSETFSLYCLVCEQYSDQTNLALSNGFHKYS